MSSSDGQTSFCEPEDLEPSKNDLPGTNLNLRQLFLIVGGLLTVVAIINCSLTFVSHFVWRTNYREQKHLVRIAILPAVFAGFYWLGILVYGQQTYLSPWVGIYEVYTITCFFEYMIEILVPHGQTREDYMVAAPRYNRRKNKEKHDAGTYRWYKVARMFCYLGLFFHTITTVAEMVIARNMCHTSSAYESAYTLLEILGLVFTFFALGALLRTYRRFNKQYQPMRLMITFWVFKGIVLLYIVESLLMRIMVSAGAAEPTQYMSSADFNWGVQSFMVCCQSGIFSFGYVIYLSGWRYRATNSAGPSYAKISDGSRQGPDYSKGRLLLDVLLPKATFVGFADSVVTFFSLFRGRRGFDYTGGTGVNYRQRKAAALDADVDDRVHEPQADSNELLPRYTRGDGSIGYVKPPGSADMV